MELSDTKLQSLSLHPLEQRLADDVLAGPMWRASAEKTGFHWLSRILRASCFSARINSVVRNDRGQGG
jgi:hypothetical protein